ncbi:ferredoxin [Pseudonocardia nigra]|uniref:ferredoxin n=1 Tax=Pseudonocardia nigra TaxID=1921578 RepID=UPI001C604007|nr:ferredoxin [Pseudonocardia nigra]
MSYTVNIEKELCCGSGLCAAMADTGFALDAQGVAEVLPTASELPDDTLLDIASSCPTLAIRLVDGDREIDVFG